MSKFVVKPLKTSKKQPDISTTTSTKITTKEIKKSKIKKWIIGFLIFLIALFFVGNIAIKAISNIRLSSLEGDAVFVPTFVIGSGAAEKIEGTKNILIAGIGGDGHEGSHLTDSIMLASINSDRGDITLLSIPRDLYVAYPKGYGVAGRINALYTIGRANKKGINLLAEKVSEITGQSIDGYVVVDFTGFKYIVNALGGIEIDVPKSIVDREYPNNNWGYEVFSVRAGPQTFNGDIALKYARSRHSTSDFDRSERQQLLMKSIKEKALSLGFLTSPSKIQEVYTAIRMHLDTSMTVGEAVDFARRIRDIDTENIKIYTLNNDCIGHVCSPGAYLYTPSRDYFAGNSVLIPENASIARLSYYEDIRRFSGFIFRFPGIRDEKYPITFVTPRGKSAQARNILSTLGKMGINTDGRKDIVEATGSLRTSRINIYSNPEFDIGFSENTTIIKALRFIEEKIPYSFVEKNEYITTEGPRIEIILGDDIQSYFTFAKPAYYLPLLTPTTTEGSVSGQSPIISGEVSQNKKEGISTTPTPSKTKDQKDANTQIVPIIQPGQWEEF